MRTFNENAVDLLKYIVRDRLWHKHKIDRGTAAQLKADLMRGRVSYKKACQTLELLGYKKIDEETWAVDVPVTRNQAEPIGSAVGG